MKTLTYGTLPSRDAILEAVLRECENSYAISHGSRQPDWAPAAGCYDGEELWAELTALTDGTRESMMTEREREREIQGTGDSPMTWASDILSTLGFEWV